MQKNQKYFPIVDRDGKLKANFITISNIQSKDPEQVKKGNERVITPRFKDAAFFWEQDLKRPLRNLSKSLKNVVYQEKLGSVFDKSHRIATITSKLAEDFKIDKEIAGHAAMLCKCDLLTNMVGEFPSLQGLMGKYYALANGERQEVASALEEHYLPRFAGDHLPETNYGQALAVSDRIDTLVGIFSVGLKPSGIKDPYGLRRAALGVLRILIEIPLDIDLRVLLENSADTLSDKVDARAVLDDVFHYIIGRLHSYYSEKGIPSDVLEAVLARNPTVPSDIDRRVRAVMHFRKLAEAKSLSAANKRIRNIIKKSDTKVSGSVDPSLFETASETSLFEEINKKKKDIQPFLENRDYESILDSLAGLKEVVDTFFDEVMVNCEQIDLKTNRHRLLNSVEGLFLEVADISRLQ